MIHLSPTPSFTLEDFRKTANFADEETSFYFMRMSHHSFEVKEGNRRLAIMGVVPVTMLSNRALIWFGPMKKVKFTRRMIREGKALGEVFFHKMPYSIYAELDTRRPDTVRFAKFFGMQKHSEHGHIHLYERAK